MNNTTSWNELLRRSDWEGRQQRAAVALNLAQDALEWAKREFGKESYEVAASWEYVAKAASFNQDESTVKAAQAAVDQLINKLSKNVATENSPESASALVYHGNLIFTQTGDDASAQQSFAKALQILEKTRGLEHTATGYLLARIGQLYDLSGDPQKALPYLERAKIILEKVLGPRDVDVAALLSDLGGAYQHAAVSMVPPNAPNPVNDSSQYSSECRALYEKSLDALSGARRIHEKIGNTDEYLYYLLYSEASTLRALGREEAAVTLENRAKNTLPPE